MLAAACILPGRTIKGGPKHMGIQVVREYVDHWFNTLGYIEFIQFKDGTIQRPSPNPWWKRVDDPISLWRDPDAVEQPAIPPSQSSGRYSTAFGSKGARLHLPELVVSDPEEKPYPEFVKLPDPADLHLSAPPGYDPSGPAWPAPALAPDGPYTRGQWVHLNLKELPCGAADSLLAAGLQLAQLPVSPKGSSRFF